MPQHKDKNGFSSTHVVVDEGHTQDSRMADATLKFRPMTPTLAPCGATVDQEAGRLTFLYILGRVVPQILWEFPRAPSS